jgi:hypothetical protein
VGGGGGGGGSNIMFSWSIVPSTRASKMHRCTRSLASCLRRATLTARIQLPFSCIQLRVNNTFVLQCTSYYGSGNGTASATAELAAATGVDGLLGMIYGSWASGPVPGDPYLGGGDYSELETCVIQTVVGRALVSLDCKQYWGCGHCALLCCLLSPSAPRDLL